MSAALSLLDLDSIGDGLWAQERGPEDNGIIVTPKFLLQRHRKKRS